MTRVHVFFRYSNSSAFNIFEEAGIQNGPVACSPAYAISAVLCKFYCALNDAYTGQ